MRFDMQLDVYGNISGRPMFILILCSYNIRCIQYMSKYCYRAKHITK